MADTREPTIDVSRMPRIPLLSYDEADAPRRKLWDEMGRPGDDGRHHIDTGHALFRTLMRHPDLKQVFTPFTLYVKESTNLPVRHRELAIMRSAWLGGVDDQWVNHTEIGIDCGLTREEIDRIPEGPDAPGWDAEDAVILRAVDELHFACRLGDETWASLARGYDHLQLIEFLLLVGQYRALSYVQNSIGIRPVAGTTPNIPGNRFLFPEP